MARRVGFVLTARSGKLEGFGIEEGTPVEETLAAMAAHGIDPDVIAALSGSTGLAKAARHAVRHPETGQFFPALPGHPAHGLWQHFGKPLPALTG